MKAFCIFDDFPVDCLKQLQEAGIDVNCVKKGHARPTDGEMKTILEEYEIVIIGTSQKIYEWMWDRITSPRIVATASVGIDHIKIPEEKRHLLKILNTPTANAQSVAEYTIGCAFVSCKRLIEGRKLYMEGKDNKKLYSKPGDLNGKILGVVGAGNISRRIMEYGACFGMNVVFWTLHPEQHKELIEKGFNYSELTELVSKADVISVNLPNNISTKGLISDDLVYVMNPCATFISVSRKETISYDSLINKALDNPSFYLCLDLDLDEQIINAIQDIPNIMITPHIAGGTTETRKRMFSELAERIANLKHTNEI